MTAQESFYHGRLEALERAGYRKPTSHSPQQNRYSSNPGWSNYPTLCRGQILFAVLLLANCLTNIYAGDSAVVRAEQTYARLRNQAVTYERHIRPILEDSCFDCHSGQKRAGRYRLDSRQRVIAGGASGYPAVVPGQSEESYLIQVVSDALPDEGMPPPRQRKRYPKLTREQVELLRIWIDQGAQ